MSERDFHSADRLADRQRESSRSSASAILEAAGIDAQALGPFAPVVEALAAIVEARSAPSPVSDSSMAEAILAASDEGLHPDRDYLPEQAARFLGVKRGTYNKISTILLPRREGGYARGVDIMAYRGQITRDEAEAYKRVKADAVRRAIRNAA